MELAAVAVAAPQPNATILREVLEVLSVTNLSAVVSLLPYKTAPGPPLVVQLGRGAESAMKELNPQSKNCVSKAVASVQLVPRPSVQNLLPK